ncbi:MAG TPA: SRPBCC domain-containing protein [Nitriliruptorales bacterium]|nr:SRPBCC domain-containing protein [Nitriliruptorales bacterium]
MDVKRSVTAVWDALAQSEQLARWFATVDPPLRPGARSRADFGDGDFFDVAVAGMTPPTELELEWSFLGVGSPHSVRWTVRELPVGARVEVVDHDPLRPPREAAEMVSGWSDFLVRLRGYLETGASTRYGVRDELDGAVDLPATGADPLSGGAILRWLPVATDGRSPSWFFVIDDEGPRRFPLSDWSLDPGRVLTFAVTIGDDAADVVPPTRCTVSVSATPEGRRLAIRQTGWAVAGLPARRARQLRSRFADTWREALRTARDLCASPTG